MRQLPAQGLANADTLLVQAAVTKTTEGDEQGEKENPDFATYSGTLQTGEGDAHSHEGVDSNTYGLDTSVDEADLEDTTMLQSDMDHGHTATESGGHPKVPVLSFRELICFRVEV